MTVDAHVIKLVVYMLGAVTCIMAGGLILLVYLLIKQGAGVAEVDPAAVAAVGLVASGFTGTSTALGGLLVSIRSSNRASDPQVAP